MATNYDKTKEFPEFSGITMISGSLSFEKPITVTELDNSIAKAKERAERNEVYKYWRKG